MNRFPPSVLDEIRARLPISRIIGASVKLKRSGRTWKGLCPFHKEKTPSFTCDDTRETWHCFGCQAHGDVFAWIMRIRGMQFGEAVQLLAADAGVSIQVSAEAHQRETVRLSLIEVMEAATDFYHETMRSDAGRDARAYLSGRGIDPGTIERFRLGYADGNLKDYLAKKGVSRDSMIEAGLLVSEEGQPARDRFYDRVIVPIKDWSGRVVGFGGRAMNPESKAKYLNSPETPIFHKGSLLYNFSAAREAALNGAAQGVVVEGYMDAIACVTRGLSETCATMGTAVTADQCRQLWRVSDEPVICFDGDVAGRKAAYRLIDVALPLLSPGRSLRFATMPNGLDPDSLLRQRGKDGLMRVIASAVPLVDALWRRAVTTHQATTPEQRSAMESDLRRKIEGIQDRSLRHDYLDDIKDRIRSLKTRPRVYRSNGHSYHSTSPGSVRLVHGSSRSGMTLSEAIAIVTLCAKPDVAFASVDTEAERLMTPLVREVVTALIKDGAVRSLTDDGLAGVLAEATTKCNEAGLTELATVANGGLAH